MQYKTKKRRKKDERKKWAKGIKRKCSLSSCLSLCFPNPPLRTQLSSRVLRPATSPAFRPHSRTRPVLSCLPRVAHFLVALFDVIIIEVKSWTSFSFCLAFCLSQAIMSMLTGRQWHSNASVVWAISFIIILLPFCAARGTVWMSFQSQTQTQSRLRRLPTFN